MQISKRPRRVVIQSCLIGTDDSPIIPLRYLCVTRKCDVINLDLDCIVNVTEKLRDENQITQINQFWETGARNAVAKLPQL